MKISWCVTPDMRDGEPAHVLIKTENNKEAIALRQFLEKMGVEIPKECLPAESDKEWWQ
jgi:hypothetical protein